MKRLIAILSVFVLLPFCYAVASDENPIMFRSVEWGASVNEVKDSFYDPVRWDFAEYGSCFGMEYWTTGKGPVYSGDVCVEYKSELSVNNKIKVAGIKASMVDLRFAVVPGEQEPAFVMGEYIFATGDLFDIFFSLTKKLSELYGKNYQETMGGSKSFNIYRVWKDEEGNAISLMNSDSVLCLRYISSKMDDLLSAAAASLEKEKDSDYGGL